jgi:branched-chain amino acid transport system permease protein
MRRPSSLLAAIALFVVLALVPPLALALHQPYYLTFLSRVMVFGIAALSLNLILGFGGMTSLGHAAFLGVGAYTVGLLIQNGITNGYVHFAAAIAFGALAALVIGAVCLRTGGLSFIMLTLASAQLLYFIAIGLKQYGGDDGFSFRGRSDFGAWLPLGDDAALYWFILGWLALATLVVHRTVHSRFGLALRGIRSNETRTASIGLHAYRYKLAAFVLSGTICAVAGALLANLAQFVSPSYMHWARSAELLLMVLLGGMASVLGPLAGAAAFMFLEEGLGLVTPHWPLLMGVILVLVVMYARNGLAELAGRLRRSARGAR